MYIVKPMMYSQNTDVSKVKLRDEYYKESILELTIEQFLKEVQSKAFRMAEIATKNQADALDIVQDTMFKLVEKYSDRPSNEWKPLFYRILQSKTVDYFRKKTLQSKIFFWKKNTSEDDDIFDVIDNASDHITPERDLEGKENLQIISIALKNLAPRQQQCFMLRSWEGLSVKETALAMNCSEGSVKTHYSRAKEALKKALGDL